MCQQISDARNNWNNPQGTFTRNPRVNETHPYTQNCSIWSFQFRNNNTDCPSVTKPDCTLMNPRNYKATCPFGLINNNTDYRTQEYCECLGATIEKMNVSHRIYCTCTRNMSKNPLNNNGKQCKEHYLFTKECVVHYPYIAKRRKKGGGHNYFQRYYFNCSFVNCHNINVTQLNEVSGFNSTCSNNTSLAQMIPSTLLPTTITLSTKTSITIVPTTFTMKSTTIETKTTKPITTEIQTTKSTTTETKTTKSTTPMIPQTTILTYLPTTLISEMYKLISSTSRDTRVPTITSSKNKYSESTNHQINGSVYNMSRYIFVKTEKSPLVFPTAELNYIKKDEGSSAGVIFLVVLLLNVFGIIGASIAVKKYNKRTSQGQLNQ